MQSVCTKSPAEQEAVTAAQKLLQTLHSVYVQAHSRSVATLAAYNTAAEAQAATDINDEDAVEAVWQQLDAAELAHESAKEAVAAAKAEFEAMVNMTNQVDDMVVRIVGITARAQGFGSTHRHQQGCCVTCWPTCAALIVQGCCNSSSHRRIGTSRRFTRY
jgi:hypothetical protein